MQKGFTVIEIIITVSIITIMSLVTIVNFPSLGAQARVKSASEEIIRALRSARNYSVAIREFSPGSNKFPNYGVYIKRNPIQIVIYADCNLDDNPPTPDGTIDHNDIFRYDPSSTTNCQNTNGWVQDVFLISRVNIITIRRCEPVCIVGPGSNQSEVHVEFLRPEPSVWLSSRPGPPPNPPPAASLLEVGHVEIVLQDTTGRFTKTIFIWNTGLIESR